MSKHLHVARRIQQLIRDEGLQPGQMLPSERALAARLGVAHATVRAANDHLYRQGLIERRHGRGTFLAETSSPAQPTRRLGIVYVDMHEQESPALHEITLTTHRLAHAAGYELVIDTMETAEMLHGNEPEMVRRRSVDGIVLYGRVKDYHLEFIEGQRLPYVVLGNRHLRAGVPQASIDVEALAYQVTCELLRIGRHPVWFDGDVNNTTYHAGVDLLKGFSRAIQDRGDGVVNLCSIKPGHVVAAAETLARSDLSRAAILVESRGAYLLNTALQMKTDQWRELLIVPISSGAAEHLSGPNVAERIADSESVDRQNATVGVRSLLQRLAGKSPRVVSTVLEPECRLETGGKVPRLWVHYVPREHAATPAGQDGEAAGGAGTTGRWMADTK